MAANSSCLTPRLDLWKVFFEVVVYVSPCIIQLVGTYYFMAVILLRVEKVAKYCRRFNVSFLFVPRQHSMSTSLSMMDEGQMNTSGTRRIPLFGTKELFFSGGRLCPFGRRLATEELDVTFHVARKVWRASGPLRLYLIPYDVDRASEVSGLE